MSCCSMKGCPCWLGPWFPRVGFGLALAGFGVNHYAHMSAFKGMASGVFTNTMLASLTGLLAYVVPALMIVGGLLFAVKKMGCISKFCILGSLGGILGWAGLAIMLGNMEMGGQMGPAIQNAGLLIVLYYIIKKMSCCSGGSCGTGSSCCTPTK